MAPSSEKWLQRLESETGTFVRKGRGKHQARRIRIAILDTGVDPRNVAFAGPVSKGLVKVEDFVTPGGDALDLHGHGTHCVGLLCRIAPEAEIYVAKVANDRNRLPDVNAVTKAIYRAVSSGKGPDGVPNWDVDIITLSLGFYQWDSGLDEALRYAHSRNKVVVVAASNTGTNDGVVFPASLPTVICIHSASASGMPSSSNQPPRPGRDLAIMGEDVESAWCCGTRDKVGKKQTNLTTRKSGTSVATSVAAGVVALILEFAQQDGPRKRIGSASLYRLRSCNGMYSVLREMSHQEGGYWTITPWMLLNKSSDGPSPANIIKSTVDRWVE